MESNRKRIGFVKSRLMPLIPRSTKPSSKVQYTSCKVVKPSQTSPTTASVGFVVPGQDYMIAPPKQKVSFIVPDNNRDRLSQFDKFFGVVGDASVDIKAASYISSVQERFKVDESIQNEIKA